MIVDLVQISTRDGVRLDGMLQSPRAGPPSPPTADAFLFVHGTGGSFYSSTLFDAFADRFLQLGAAVLRVNTRGHDLISTASTTEGGRRIGAAYEVVDDCRHDLAAWIEWLSRRGFGRIGLVGHSLGAVKAIYTLAHEPQPAVVCLVALSPPRLSYSHFSSGPQGPNFLKTTVAAEEHVRAGRSEVLMDVKFPLPFVVTAAGYLEKYGPEERYNFLKFVARVPCRTLVTFGSIELENNIAFRGSPELLAPIAARTDVKVEVIENADHFYSQARDIVVELVTSWLQVPRTD